AILARCPTGSPSTSRSSPSAAWSVPRRRAGEGAMRSDAPAVAALLLLSACGPVAVLTRPQGDGCWSPGRRPAEHPHRAAVARGALDGAPPAAPEPPAGALTLGEALRLAAAHNRRIAEAERGVEIAGARVAEARGRLLPSTTGSGRYTRYTDPLTTTVSF